MPKRKSKSSSSKKSKSSTAYRLSIRVKKSPRKAKSLSKRKSKSKSVSKGKLTWFQAVAKARKELNIKGFVAIKKGTPLYKRAKELYGPAKTV